MISKLLYILPFLVFGQLQEPPFVNCDKIKDGAKLAYDLIDMNGSILTVGGGVTLYIGQLKGGGIINYSQPKIYRHNVKSIIYIKRCHPKMNLSYNSTYIKMYLSEQCEKILKLRIK